MRIINGQHQLLFITTLIHFFWGIGATSFDIEKSYGYLTWETTRGPCYHTPGPPSPCPAVLIEDKVLMSAKFLLEKPDSLNAYIIDYIRIAGPTPIELPREVFYDTVVPKLISPSIALDNQNIIHIIWDGIKDSIRYYTISDTSISKIVFNPSKNVFEPYISKSNSQISLTWAERSASSSYILSRYTFSGNQILSQTDEIYTQTEYLGEPFISKNYITFLHSMQVIQFILSTMQRFRLKSLCL